MTGPARRIALLAAALALPACGSGGSDLTRAEATERLVSIVDQTAADVAGSQPITPEPDKFAATRCEDDQGDFEGTYNLPYSVTWPLPEQEDISAIFARTREYWEKQGYDVGEVDGAETSLVAMHSEVDGFGIVLRVDKESSEASVGGTTPCVKKS